MKTYARVTNANEARYYNNINANEWYEVTEEYIKWFPSGQHRVFVIQGKAFKAKHCEVVSVFTK